jgi:hypothetical protein
LAQPRIEPDARRRPRDSIELDAVIAEHAANARGFQRPARVSLSRQGAPVMKDIPDPLGHADYVLLGRWYGLSYYDMNFGFRMISAASCTISSSRSMATCSAFRPNRSRRWCSRPSFSTRFWCIGFIVLKRRGKQIWAGTRKLLRLHGTG